MDTKEMQQEAAKIKQATEIKNTVMTSTVMRKKKKKKKPKAKKEITKNEKLVQLCKILGALIFLHIFMTLYLALRR